MLQSNKGVHMKEKEKEISVHIDSILASLGTVLLVLEDAKVNTPLTRIVQEAVQDAYKHAAHASNKVLYKCQTCLDIKLPMDSWVICPGCGRTEQCTTKTIN